MSRGTGNELDTYPFVRLAQSRLPPRVRGLVEGAYQAAQPVIDAALVRALDELDRDLLAHTERGSNASEQTQSFAGLRELRLRRADFMLACRAGVQRSLLSLVDTSVHDETLMPVSARDSWGNLSAAEAAAREEDLTLSQIATRAEIRAGVELQALAYRFGAIAGSPAIEALNLPLGPYRLCAVFRACARRLAAIPAHRMALYRRIDKALFSESGSLYEAVNRYLIDHRVFAHLCLAPAPEDVAAGATSPAPAAAPAPAAQPAAPAESSAPIRAEEAVARATPALPDAVAASADAASTHDPAQSAAASPIDGLRRAPAPAAAVPLDAHFFRVLREQLASERRASSDAEPGEMARPFADRRELQLALSELQAQPPAPILVEGTWANRTVAHVKQDLMNQLRSLGDGGPPKLRDEDSEVIDLVGMLFAQLLAAYRPNSVCHGVVSRLQIPVLRVALRDSGFFTRRAHPARRFLNALIECIADWVEDEDADRSVIEKLQMVVDRLLREFDDDLAAFDRCLDELEKHLASLNRKADVAERRHVEAAKGREKLDLARAAAQEAVQLQLRGANAPQAIVTLLENAWTDAVALSLLRQGVDHPKTQARIVLVEQLLAVFDAGHTPESRHAALERLRPVLEEGLAAVGFHDDAIGLAWNDVCELVDARNEQARHDASRAIAELIRQKPRFGGDAASGGAAAQGAQSGFGGEEHALDPAEREMVDYLRQLPLGTWFEFSAGRNAAVSRRRLSWLSQATGRCLFVNARGARCDDRSIGQLAREMLHGSAHVAPEDRDQPVDRAWQAIRAAARDARPVPAPARPPTNH